MPNCTELGATTPEQPINNLTMGISANERTINGLTVGISIAGVILVAVLATIAIAVICYYQKRQLRKDCEHNKKMMISNQKHYKKITLQEVTHAKENVDLLDTDTIDKELKSKLISRIKENLQNLESHINSASIESDDGSDDTSQVDLIQIDKDLEKILSQFKTG